MAAIRGDEHAKVQLSIEYDPAPPFDSGTPEKADSGVLKRFYVLAGTGGGERAARVQAVAKRLLRAKAFNKV